MKKTFYIKIKQNKHLIFKLKLHPQSPNSINYEYPYLYIMILRKRMKAIAYINLLECLFRWSKQGIKKRLCVSL